MGSLAVHETEGVMRIMDKLDRTIEEIINFKALLETQAVVDYPLVNTLNNTLELLKEQQAIIDQYHQADTFLAVHGWQWKITTDSGTSPKDGDGE